MFASLDTQELVNLGHKLVSANRAVVIAYGVDSDLNADILGVFDDFEDAAYSHNITI